jgi:uncharacterized protein (UPF0548 family)
MRLVRAGHLASMNRLLSEAQAGALTYLERGATLTGELPDGYHHLSDETILGYGSQAFATASEGLRTWQTHRFRGVRVFPPDARLKTDTTVVVTLGLGIGAVAAPCRVVAVVDESRRFGFAYGTLPGHPERGEESFIVTIGNDDVIRFEISAFSRPADLTARMVGPLGRKIQSAATKRYFRALHRFVDRKGPIGSS